MYEIEEERNSLVYGKPKKYAIDSVINAFWKLYELIKEQTGEEFE